MAILGTFFAVWPTVSYSFDLVASPTGFHLPRATFHQLGNGLKIVVVERRSLPLVTLRLVVRAGAECDPPDKCGLAQMMANLLTTSTSQRTA